MDFGSRLKQLRGTRSQTEVAEAMGFKQSTYAMYENGKREPGFSNLCRIADYFGVSVDYLLGRTDYKGFDGDIRNACDLLGISQETVENLSFCKKTYPKSIGVVDDFLGDYNRILSISACIEQLKKETAWLKYLGSKSDLELSQEFQQDQEGILRLSIRLSSADRQHRQEIIDILSKWATDIVNKSIQSGEVVIHKEFIRHEIALENMIAEANRNFAVTIKRGSPPPLSETETQILIRPDEEVPTAEEVMQILEDRINGETQSS